MALYPSSTWTKDGIFPLLRRSTVTYTFDERKHGVCVETLGERVLRVDCIERELFRWLARAVETLEHHLLRLRIHGDDGLHEREREHPFLCEEQAGRLHDISDRVHVGSSADIVR